MKKIILLSILVASLFLIGAGCQSKNSQSATPAATETSEVAPYFSEDAKVMYFYSDECTWCQKEKDVLNELSNKGYKLKPMNVGKDPALWDEYKIEGTPTFIAQNGDRLSGYQEKDPLREWLKQHQQ